MIKRHDIALKISEYLNHAIDMENLVNWSENAMMENELDPHYAETLRNILARLGLADVREFGLSWEDCEDFLIRLGYKVRIQVSESSEIT
jgi:hypothetical protein